MYSLVVWPIENGRTYSIIKHLNYSNLLYGLLKMEGHTALQPIFQLVTGCMAY